MPSRLTPAALVCGLFLSAAACGRHVAEVPDQSDGRPRSTVIASAGAAGGEPATLERTASKVNLLFDIDNSASMGDKLEYLARAAPDLITRLATPNCLAADGLTALGRASLDGTCAGTAAGGTVEFPPVHDLHIGIVRELVARPSPRRRVHDSEGLQHRGNHLRPDAARRLRLPARRAHDPGAPRARRRPAGPAGRREGVPDDS
jgi:hypothetical protein